MKNQLTQFVETNKILSNQMHGSRKKYSIVTAKMCMDKEINLHKDAGHQVAVINTDLSAAYNTVSHAHLLTKLKHIGLRGKELKFLSSFLEDRKFFADVQGFCSSLRDLPNCSIVQGSKMSSLFYSLFTNETVHLNKQDQRSQKLTPRNDQWKNM